MDPQLLHLRLNHLPVVGALWTLAFLVFALFRPSASRAKLALALTVVLAGTVVLAYLTGGPAEEKIEHLAGVVEPAIGAHEEAADVALGFGIGVGVIGLAGLWAVTRDRGRWVRLALVAAALGVAAESAVLALTAHRGGLVHRPELGAGGASPAAEHQDQN